ncbi:MAG: ornithine carbamoyltransferase [Candidatus Latescibacteria bacterium]|nr:ornithine carbamoyltransferase [Candidatus Latescibacterota bacterium]
MKHDLISLGDLSKEGIYKIIYKAIDLKAELKFEHRLNYLNGKNLALVFEKPSLRTRVTFEVAIRQLGGSAIYLSQQDIGIGKRESVADIAKNLSRWVDCIAARTFAHKTVLDLAKYSEMPVINALSDLEHPCQALADYLTIYDVLGKIEGVTLAWIGDGNNVCNSLMLGAAILGVNMKIATPKGCEPRKEIVERALALAKNSSAQIALTDDPVQAVKGSEFIYTDTWTSMGQEAEAEKRKAAFSKFQVNKKLLEHAPHIHYVMHCLPAHRGEEITDEVLDGPQSIVLEQAENRMHVQRAILAILLG